MISMNRMEAEKRAADFWATLSHSKAGGAWLKSLKQFSASEIGSGRTVPLSVSKIIRIKEVNYVLPALLAKTTREPAVTETCNGPAVGKICARTERHPKAKLRPHYYSSKGEKWKVIVEWI